jgi:hypothetical protein
MGYIGQQTGCKTRIKRRVNMKRLIALLTILLLFGALLWADTDGHTATVDEVINEIREELELREEYLRILEDLSRDE